MTMTRMTSLTIVLVVAGLLALGRFAPGLTPVDDEGEGRLPDLASASLPAPPGQADPWTPPETRLPKFLVPACEALFEQGLADPRGCEYREIELAGADSPPVSFPGREEPELLHGWVLPTKEGEEDGPRFAVCWNGLVAPLARIGEPADLEADVRGMLIILADRLDSRQSRPFFNEVAGHLQTASQEHPTPINVCMLLRLGRVDLAEDLFAALTGWTRDRPAIDLKNYGVSYLSLASDWAWSMFDRAAISHATGQDALALADLRALSALRGRVEAQAEAMGLPRPSRDDQGGTSYLNFLEPLDDLLADQERREAEGPRPSLDEIARIEDRSERIEALVQALDDINMRASAIMNGYASFFANEDPIARALIAEGFDAVGPLADEIEADDRLTRTVDRSSRMPMRTLRVLSVRWIAHDTAIEILGSRNLGTVVRFNRFDRPTAEERRRLADAIRAYAQQFRDLPDEERWYRLLQDDSATVAQRFEAADRLARLQSDRQRDGGPPVLADVKPTVSELLARRIRELDRVDRLRQPDGTIELTPGTGTSEDVATANRFSQILLRWDSEAALPVLVERSARCGQVLRGTARSSNRKQQLATDLTWLTLARADLGDEAALDEFAAVMTDLAPDQFDSFPTQLFEPLWTYSEHPSIAALVDRMYGDPMSPWLPLTSPEDGFWSGRGPGQLVRSPMLGLAPFRSRVLEALGDPSPVGSVWVDENGRIEIRLNRTTSRAEPLDDDPLRPASGTRMNVRMADVVASLLGSVGGIPRIEFWWPESRRDESIDAARAFLDHFGDRFRPSQWHPPVDPDRSRVSDPPFASVAFAPMDRPATDDDLERGLALFSLEGRGDRRIVPLADRPLQARWLTLNDTPQVIHRQDPETGESTREVRYLQDGWVWQAEEVFEDGEWRRFYGFLGHSSYGAAPAEEVEFPSPVGSGWARLTDSFDARIVSPGARTSGDRLYTPPASMEGPLPIEVAIRNRVGLERSALAPIGPVEAEVVWILDRPTLREGVTLALSFTPISDPPTRGPRDRAEPVSVTGRPISQVAAEQNGPTLAPGASSLLLRTDLWSFFELVGPGSYQLVVTFEDLIGPDGEPARIVSNFNLRAPADPAAP